LRKRNKEIKNQNILTNSLHFLSHRGPQKEFKNNYLPETEATEAQGKHKNETFVENDLPEKQKQGISYFRIHFSLFQHKAKSNAFPLFSQKTVLFTSF
jgi:hypothetical protein